MEPAIVVALISIGVALINMTAVVTVAVLTIRGNARLAEIAKGVDGLTKDRIAAETRIGEANAVVAEGRGRDSEREKGEQKAEILAALVPVVVPVEVVKAGPDVIVPVKVIDERGTKP